ncbi:hypothetical protein H2198_004730 [Neophaeococcomyces mojaviensis]|uniref:Uncharacterized protein n=1 Tax=Neophaeococcomyces mojaviensis TaxID=3383035 RepID=A0ACC3A846_9EURO|nr:hypothetical protein H2198_004730 [Knufia sp. JES_112]
MSNKIKSLFSSSKKKEEFSSLAYENTRGGLEPNQAKSHNGQSESKPAKDKKTAYERWVAEKREEMEK